MFTSKLLFTSHDTIAWIYNSSPTIQNWTFVQDGLYLLDFQSVGTKPDHLKTGQEFVYLDPQFIVSWIQMVPYFVYSKPNIVRIKQIPDSSLDVETSSTFADSQSGLGKSSKRQARSSGEKAQKATSICRT